MASSTPKGTTSPRAHTPRSAKPATVRAATPRRNLAPTECSVIEALPGRPSTPRISSIASKTKSMQLGAAYDELDRARLEHARSGDFRKADAIKAEMNALKALREEALREEHRAEHRAFLRAVEETHVKELEEFERSWNEKMALQAQEGEALLREFDERMREAHGKELQRLRAETEPKAPRWSRDYLQLRRQQERLSDQQRYDEAGDFKAMADKLEAKEQQTWEASRDKKIATAESQWLARTTSERSGLEARIVAGQQEFELIRSQERQRLVKRFHCVKAESTTKYKITGNFVEKKGLVYSPVAALGGGHTLRSVEDQGAGA